MEMMPPVGWADVATKRDLDALEERMNLRFQALEVRFDARFESMDHRFESMEQQFGLQLEATKHELVATFRGELLSAVTTRTRTLMLANVGAMLSTAVLAFGAAKLL